MSSVFASVGSRDQEDDIDEARTAGERVTDLEKYLQTLLSFIGGHRSDFWNHPTVMNFFDIPISVI